MNHFEHNGADNTIDSYDNNHEDGDDNAGDEDHGRGDDDGNNDHDDYANDHGHDDDGNGNNHKDSYDHVEGDINNHGDDDSDDIWSVREGPSMRHILLRETQRNCKQDQVNNANSAFIFLINLLIGQGCGSLG